MSSLYLSRARLKALRGEALSAVAPLLVPRSKTDAPLRAHRVLWMLFQAEPDSERDFLWRDEGGGRYLILSPRPPADPHSLFELDTKSFQPDLERGDRLRFSIRANPVIRIDQQEMRVTAKGRATPKRKKVDVVMHALRDVATTEWDDRTGRAVSGRALERDAIMTRAATDWLKGQGASHGFELSDAPEPEISNYIQVPLDRRPAAQRRAAGESSRGRRGGFSMLDMTGTIVVRDPAAFLTKLTSGFGSAKAFGCGLMLIRRAA
jgi:CRISPR system Cascade subunit CasE